MSDAKLVSPEVRVLMADGSTLELQTANPDLVLWDRTSVKKRWPTFQQANFLWLTFISWSAARRTGAIAADFTYERWESEVLQVEPINVEDEDAGGPTEPGPVPG